MKTDCSTQGTLFADVAGRDAVVRFDAGAVTSSAGVLLLERTDRRLGLLRRFAGCFRDHRARGRVQHTVLEMVRQRVFGLCLGYEDIVDHDHVGKDPLLVAACGRKDGALATHPTLSRPERPRIGASALVSLSVSPIRPIAHRVHASACSARPRLRMTKSSA